MDYRIVTVADTTICHPHEPLTLADVESLAEWLARMNPRVYLWLQSRPDDSAVWRDESEWMYDPDDCLVDA